jgi:Holliday junction resolvasome RuvABC endonuclease subunit
MSADTILGINPGTRLVGIAVMRKRALLHFEIKSFPGVWSPKKLRAILSLVESTMQRYEVTKVTVKIPDVLPASLGFTQVVGSLNSLWHRVDIKPRYYTFSEIKAKHCKEDMPTGKSLMEAIVRKYPELSPEYHREQRNKEGYYYKVFEAVAVAGMPTGKR